MAKPKKRPEPPEIRAHDKDGNVRPADGRYLTKAQKDKQQAYIESAAQAGDPAAVAKLREQQLAAEESAEAQPPADSEEDAKAVPGGPADAEPEGKSDGDK